LMDVPLFTVAGFAFIQVSSLFARSDDLNNECSSIAALKYRRHRGRLSLRSTVLFIRLISAFCRIFYAHILYLRI
jgi:hypothetical protein